MQTFELFLGGKFVRSSVPVVVYNKFTQEALAQTYLAGVLEVEQALDAAVKAKSACAALSSFERYTALMHIANGMQEEKIRLSKLLAAEAAKPYPYALAEIERAIQTFVIAAEESKRLPSELLSLDWTPLGKNKSGLVKYFPGGVVAGISPFNFPMNLAVHKLAPAIACGCPIVLKPASSTPLSTLALAQIIAECKLPAGAVSILPMSRATGQMLVEDNRVHLLSFTGSPEVGWKLKEKAGKKKVVLELGGNAGVIISRNSNVSELLSKAVNGAFAYSGQICIHAQRFFVHSSQYATFCKEMVREAELLQCEDPLLESSKFSCMIDEENAIRAELWVQEAVAQGAKLLCGGTRAKNYFMPTILTNTTAAMKVRYEEVFAPVICIEPYTDNITEAISHVNEGKFGLQAGVFTDSIAELDLCFQLLEVGGVIHNNVPTLRFDHMPYGGVKESGLGREGVKYAMLDMLEPKILVK